MAVYARSRQAVMYPHCTRWNWWKPCFTLAHSLRRFSLPDLWIGEKKNRCYRTLEDHRSRSPKFWTAKRRMTYHGDS